MFSLSFAGSVLRGIAMAYPAFWRLASVYRSLSTTLLRACSYTKKLILFKRKYSASIPLSRLCPASPGGLLGLRLSNPCRL